RHPEAGLTANEPVKDVAGRRIYNRGSTSVSEVRRGWNENPRKRVFPRLSAFTCYRSFGLRDRACRSRSVAGLRMTSGETLLDSLNRRHGTGVGMATK